MWRYAHGVAISLALIFGCNGSRSGSASGLTRENVASIKDGMTVAGVEKLLGTSDEIRRGWGMVVGVKVPAETRIYRNGGDTVEVIFSDGIVVAKIDNMASAHINPPAPNPDATSESN